MDTPQFIVINEWLENHHQRTTITKRWPNYFVQASGREKCNAFIANGTVPGVWDLQSLPIQMECQRKFSMSVAELTKHSIQNAFAHKRLPRTRRSISYTGNQVHDDVSKWEGISSISRTGFKESLVPVAHIPGSQNAVRRNASIERTNENINATCIAGLSCTSDGV